MKTATPLTSARIDRWLWVARFYKTRSQAAAAVEGGKVRLNEARPKTAGGGGRPGRDRY